MTAAFMPIKLASARKLEYGILIGTQEYLCIALGPCTGTAILENNLVSLSQIKQFYSWE